LLAREIWTQYFPGIIPDEQIEYMLEQSYSHESIQRDILDSRICYELIMSLGKVAGYAAHGPKKLFSYTVHKLYIGHSYQHCGLGRYCMDHIINVARGQQCNNVKLAVNKKNHQAIDAYHKWGFTIKKEVVDNIGGGFVRDDYIMQKNITAE